MFCHCPLALQSWGCSSAHVIDPGVHIPLQVPAAHTLGQTVPVSCHKPSAPQVCG
jgi:hypothetical protein